MLPNHLIIGKSLCYGNYWLLPRSTPRISIIMLSHLRKILLKYCAMLLQSPGTTEGNTQGVQDSTYGPFMCAPCKLLKLTAIRFLWKYVLWWFMMVIGTCSCGYLQRRFIWRKVTNADLVYAPCKLQSTLNTYKETKDRSWCKHAIWWKITKIYTKRIDDH